MTPYDSTPAQVAGKEGKVSGSHYGPSVQSPLAGVRAQISKLPAEHQRSVHTYADTIRNIMNSEDEETQMHMILAITLLYSELQESLASEIKRQQQ